MGSVRVLSRSPSRFEIHAALFYAKVTKLLMEAGNTDGNTVGTR